jgi:hypothetical protein
MTLITLEPDMSIEPGHQWLLLDDSLEGAALAILLTGDTVLEEHDGLIHVPHTADVDERIVKLIDELAHVRFSAPNMVQMIMAEVTE